MRTRARLSEWFPLIHMVCTLWSYEKWGYGIMGYDRYVFPNGFFLSAHCTTFWTLYCLYRNGDVTVMYSNANTNILVDLGYSIEIQIYRHTREKRRERNVVEESEITVIRLMV